MNNEEKEGIIAYREWMEFVEMDILSARYLMEAPFHPRPLGRKVTQRLRFNKRRRSSIGQRVLPVSK